jgi:hypothetical protein
MLSWFIESPHRRNVLNTFRKDVCPQMSGLLMTS